MKRFLSWSGGKDSTASLILCHNKGVRLDGVIFCEVMFDNKRGISGEDPEFINWVYSVAMPKVKEWGYNVIVLRDKEDYMSLFHHKIKNSKNPSHIGKKRGWLIGRKCAANDRLKMRPIKKFFKDLGQVEEIIGIAVDETSRLNRLHKAQNKWSILERYNISSARALEICKQEDLLAPTYKTRRRGGCWFCPNSSIKEFGEIAKNYPDLWAELEKLSCESDLVSDGFKYGRTFQSVNREVKVLKNQISIFDEVEKNESNTL